MIFEDALTEWKGRVPWREERQVEQDLILRAMVQAIYADIRLAGKLAFRGGTCLNQLFWKSPHRYSEDLDFVQMTAEQIGPTVKGLKEVLNPIFEESPSWETKKGSFRLYYSFQPEGEPNYRQRIKIEINTREHFALEGYQRKKLVLDSMWRSGEAWVTTFSLEELLATKLRALYQRRKGRDLFDLWKSRELSPDYARVVALCLEYFRRMGKPLYQGHFLKNLEEKLKIHPFLLDLDPLIQPTLNYEVSESADFVRDTILCLFPESGNAKKKKRRL